MDKLILPLLMGAPPQQGAEATPADAFVTFLPFIAVFLIFYLLVIRPNSKKRKEAEKMIAALKKGDRIVTIGGLYGTIQNVKENTVIIKADDNVKLEFLRSAISTVVTQAKEDKAEDKDESENKDE